MLVRKVAEAGLKAGAEIVSMTSQMKMEWSFPVVEALPEFLTEKKDTAMNIYATLKM